MGEAARADATTSASDAARDAARRQQEARTAFNRAITTKPAAIVIVTDGASAIGPADGVRVVPSRIRDGVARVLDQP